MRRNDPAIQDLEMTMSKYKRTVYGIAVTQLNNRHEADDVFQEVFLLYFSKRPVFQNEEQKRAWLIRATVNKCRQYNFGKWNLHVDRTAEPEISAEFESQADKELYAAVKELPQKLREAVYLHWFIGMNVGETADILGVRANTVSMRLAKAKKLLQKRLEEEI